MEPQPPTNYSTSATRENPAILPNLLPRAVLRPNGFLLLDGPWHFAHDIDDQGHPYEYTAQ